MTSLRTFQSEMDAIRHREVVKQRGHVAPDPKRDQKQPLPSKGKAKDDEQILPEKKSDGKGKEQAKEKAKDADPIVESEARREMVEVEETILASTFFIVFTVPLQQKTFIQEKLQSNVPADHDTAREMLAALLTQHRGEYVFRIGMQPGRTQLFSGALTDASDGWTGIPRTESHLDLFKERITKTVEEVGGKTSVLFETRTGTHPRISLLLRLPPPSVSLTPEVRCAVVGNVDSGKSTTLGVLTRGALDDGRGRARVSLFRHKHEIETGRTSSVGMEILGFGPSGAAILPQTINSGDPDTVRHEKLGWDEISVQAAKIVSFIGIRIYIAPSRPESHADVRVPKISPVMNGISKQRSNKTEETIKQAVKILMSPGCRLCPIFQISNVTGEGLDYVRTFLNLLPSSEVDDEKFAVDQPLEFSVTDVWSVPYVGTVVNGILNAGSARTGDAVLLGPDANGAYIPTVIKSMQRKRADVTTAEAGQCVSFALKRVRRTAVRKGMVLVPKSETPPRSTRQFEGQVLILYHNTTLQKNYQAVRQTVRIVEILDHPQGVLRTGDRATVHFEFISQPEFVKVGMKLLFREGKTKSLISETPYPSSSQTSLGSLNGISASYSLSPDPRQWGSDLSINLVEPDDEIHNPARGATAMRIDREGAIFSTRGLANFGCLLILGFGLLALFAGYPMASYFTKKELSTQGGFNLGGINGTGQVPAITGNRGLIDVDTPKSAYTIQPWTGSTEMQLVFSDEFNVDGRTFYPGDDPYWEAVDLHYWATNNLEWYDPEAITTMNGSLVITLSEKQTHNLSYEGGMMSTWNKFCFTGGYLEASVQLPGANNVVGLWPAVWTMGNLGRAGYGATLEGLWPYTYDACDVGTAPNQTINGLPLIATTSGEKEAFYHLSYLPGQRLSRCTCQGESHPGPVHSDGTYVGRSAPEIDVFEALVNSATLTGQVSQSCQWAPFNEYYSWANTTANLIIPNITGTTLNEYVGGKTQMTTSALTWTNPNSYELNGGGFSIYGFEYLPGFDTGYITWISDNQVAWTLRAPGLAADNLVEVSDRPVPQEPMNFGQVDFEHLTFPTHMSVDYIRVYQPRDSINIGCSPPGFPTESYINTCVSWISNAYIARF
ncbi:hypothetical protein H0H81_011875 [Sphagnurus paluster]|uniref:GH16 domain-containing protein n=1 Tax=Sphagnurus paluster TaxID=117069 RepID=A0A9P7FUB0_9AGAR|nr:hypothetical protein H0H81_011875 [Sphagnurus paluster]